MADVTEGLVVILSWVAMLVGLVLYAWCKRNPAPELEQRAEAALVAHEARAARAMAILSEQAARRAQLPYFPYAAQGRASETLCAICVEPLLQGQLCSEVPACRHAFHRDCLGVWAKSKGTCPLCRVKIVPGSDEVAVADGMV